MPDIRLVQNNIFPQESVTVDWNLLSYGGLDERQALATAIIVALGTDALADEHDILPDPDSSDRRGWWGDLDAIAIWDGWPIGSRLWLMQRSAILPTEAYNGGTLQLIENYIYEAIQPFIERRVASSFTVEVTRSTARSDRVDALIRIYRGPTLEIDLQFQILWDEYPIRSISDTDYNIGRLISPD
jgi:phage gp46-like protein